MLHPDYQYDPRLIIPMATLITDGDYDVVLASRILANDVLRNGMPFYKYLGNRFLTAIENIFLGTNLSEFHTGYRAFSKDVLETIPFERNSNDFVFDNEILVQCIYFGFRIGEISCRVRYFKEASSIDFSNSIIYGIGVMKTMFKYHLQKTGVKHYNIFYRTKGLSYVVER
jgi:hypothetical protein